MLTEKERIQNLIDGLIILKPYVLELTSYDFGTSVIIGAELPEKVSKKLERLGWTYQEEDPDSGWENREWIY